MAPLLIVSLTAFFSANVSASVVFVPGPPTSATSTLSVSPNSLVADGVQTTTVSFTEADASGNLTPGQNVTFSVSGTGYSFSSTTATTSASGVATTTLKATKAEIKAITASSGSATHTVSVAFVPGPFNVAASS